MSSFPTRYLKVFSFLGMGPEVKGGGGVLTL